MLLSYFAQNILAELLVTHEAEKILMCKLCLMSGSCSIIDLLPKFWNKSHLCQKICYNQQFTLHHKLQHTIVEISFRQK